ncbi:MAG: hypothetical protein KDD84_14860, partial [Caldilineaceae bacterium]|nr:hypothetical protein [Caldilineaceae bacterium]
MNLLTGILALITSPLGPPITLLIGAVLVWTIGRVLHRPQWQSAVALTSWLLAIWLTVLLRLEPVVPIFSRPWQPFVMGASQLLWVSDGWNWYVSVLLLLLGGVAILLSGFGGQYVDRPSYQDRRRATLTLSAHLGVLATALLFVGSGNILTVTLTWVLMDILVLARNAIAPQTRQDENGHNPSWL